MKCAVVFIFCYLQYYTRVSHIRNFSHVLTCYGYSHGKSSDQIYYLVPPVLTLTSKIRNVKHILVNHLHCLRIPLVICLVDLFSFEHLLLTNRYFEYPTSKEMLTLINTILICSCLS